MRGRVTDAEVLPIAGATVLIDALAVHVVTSIDGGFEFVGVPVGSYAIEAHKPGYNSRGLRIEVFEGEATQLVLIIEKLAVEEPFLWMAQHVFDVQYDFALGLGAQLLNPILNATGGSACGQTDCHWTIEFPGAPDVVVFELDGRHGIPNPASGDAVTMTLWVGEGIVWGCYTRSSVTSHLPGFLDSGEVEDCRLPLKVQLNQTFLTEEARTKVDKMRARPICEDFWVCVDDRYHGYVTGFFRYADADIPPDFSARPPE